MRQLLLGTIAFLFAILIGIAPAIASPHHEETDGCDHGATSVPCRPDPSENGQDCTAHGNHGGVNEDHCDDTTTPTQPEPTTTTTQPQPTTTTTSPESSTTTTTTPGGTDGSPSTTTTTLPTPTNDTSPPATLCQDANGYPYTTWQDTCPLEVTAIPLPISQTELPRTGWDAGLLFVIGTALFLAGLSCWFAGKAMGE